MSAPYYADGAVTLWLGDCREVTAWLVADVLVTDPPYGISYKSRKATDRVIAGDVGPELRDEIIAQWGTRPAIVFGTWRVARPESTAAMLIWDKAGAGGFVRDHPNIPWGRTHEEIYVMGRWPELVPGGRAREGGLPSASISVLRVSGYNPAASERPEHPTPKPVALMESLIVRTSGVIADPFAGSGSTLVAAAILGRRAIGIEINERYCEIAARRLSQGVLNFGTAS